MAGYFPDSRRVEESFGDIPEGPVHIEAVSAALSCINPEVRPTARIALRTEVVNVFFDPGGMGFSHWAKSSRNFK